MEYTTLGKSGIEISRLCVGCMSFGDPASKMHAWTLNPEESEEIIKHALHLGINFFDTANCYSAGTSEEYLGKALKENVARDKVVIATKVYFNEGHLSGEAIPREVDGSLKRLGTDYVDLLIIHRFDYSTPVEETMDADMEIVKRVAALAEKKGCTMSQIALAWQFAKGVTAPIIGATKAKYFDDAAGSFLISLSEEEIKDLEEMYLPHKIVGAL